MSLQNQNENACSSKKSVKRAKPSRDPVDFCKVGGLNHHLKTLREIIIFPLLHGNVFTHFDIKAPRGVLFYGPPGTGKTLVAAALVTEINREGIGKVAFFPRKGADVLDKWVGGSEKNLRDLFDKAMKSKPSIIFFDELDGLAPVRDKQTDQIHSSVVATLLALMDGLDNKPGVIVIGATNRIEAVDPALRRPGRFDKELYFPLPGVEARRQILEVHTSSWKHKPTPRLLGALVEATSGFSGADLHALCSDAILRCLKRLYPCLESVKIDPEKIKVEECDFLNARLCQVPSTQKNGLKMRKLSAIIRPLLQEQLKNIIRSIRTFWPHFLHEDYKYCFGEERYAGRVLLVGNSTQGLDTHLIPALLQQFEYLPAFVYDVTNLKKNFILSAQLHYPSVMLLSKIDEWWNIIDECDQQSIASSLEDIHAGLPVLIVATCRTDVPYMLQNFFYNNSCILLKIENPTVEERKAFLKPLFFDANIVSLKSVLDNCRRAGTSDSKHGKKSGRSSSKRKVEFSYSATPSRKRAKTRETRLSLQRPNSTSSIYNIEKGIKSEIKAKRCDSVDSFNPTDKAPYFTVVLSSALKRHDGSDKENEAFLKTLSSNKKFASDSKTVLDCNSFSKINNNDPQLQHISDLWHRTAIVTSKNMSVAQLELLYDVVSACINIHWSSFDNSVQYLEDILKNIEKSILDF